MTIDEAIEREETRIKYMGVFLPCDGCMINDCKEYRRQLAEWLKELKHLRADRNMLLNVINDIQAEINTPNRGTCDYFIVDKIEEIINKYKAESEVKADADSD